MLLSSVNTRSARAASSRAASLDSAASAHPGGSVDARGDDACAVWAKRCIDRAEARPALSDAAAAIAAHRASSGVGPRRSRRVARAGVDLVEIAPASRRRSPRRASPTSTSDTSKAQHVNDAHRRAIGERDRRRRHGRGPVPAGADRHRRSRWTRAGTCSARPRSSPPALPQRAQLVRRARRRSARGQGSGGVVTSTARRLTSEANAPSRAGSTRLSSSPLRRDGTRRWVVRPARHAGVELLDEQGAELQGERE
jgi:hypothetical protein